jgi:SPP1 gp7 family putative phage head morphogenesis protein
MPQIPRTPDDELGVILDRSGLFLFDDINRIIAAEVNRDPEAKKIALREYADSVTTAQAIADMLGRRRYLLEANYALKTGLTAPSGQVVLRNEPRIIPNVPFAEAIEALAQRLPVGIDDQLVSGLFGTGPDGELNPKDFARAVQRVYSESLGFALAKSADQVITSRVRDLIMTSLKEGKPIRNSVDAIDALGDWSRGYAGTVYRTNLANAYSAGRFQVATRPSIRRVAPALQFVTQRDNSVRDGHAALDGIIAGVDDPFWMEWTPPLSYNCRCSLRLVPFSRAKSAGVILTDNRVRPVRAIPAGAAKEPGFGRRPDIAVYQGRSLPGR